MVWIVEPDLSLTEYANDDDVLGIALDRPGMALHPQRQNPVMAGYDIYDTRRILELIDDNGNGRIDDIGELRSLYRADAAVEVVTWGIPNHAMDVDYAPDESLWLLDNVGKTIVRFVDLTGDGDYLDEDEAAVVYEATVAGQQGGFVMDFPRAVVFAAEPACTGDLDGDGDTDQADLGALLAAYGQTAGGDLDGDGDTDQADLGTLLGDYGCGR
jgi:hypothetical protein